MYLIWKPKFTNSKNLSVFQTKVWEKDSSMSLSFNKFRKRIITPKIIKWSHIVILFVIKFWIFNHKLFVIEDNFISSNINILENMIKQYIEILIFISIAMKLFVLVYEKLNNFCNMLRIWFLHLPISKLFFLYFLYS